MSDRQAMMKIIKIMSSKNNKTVPDCKISLMLIIKISTLGQSACIRNIRTEVTYPHV